jgi:peptidyl-prolyl cis-trans isomerase SurA
LLILGGTADQVVAVVDTDPILASDLEAMMLLTRLETPMVDVSQDSLKDVLLDHLIDQKLIFKKAAQDTMIAVDYQELSSGVERQLDLFYSQIDSFPDIADSLNTWGLTRQRMRQILLNEARYQSTVQQMLLIQGKTQPYVSPNQIREYYEQNKDSIAVVPGYIELAHIALAINPSQEEMYRVEQKFTEVLSILSRGGEFDVVASSFSEDPETRRNGGSLGWIKKGELVPEIDSVLFSIPVGQVAGPVPSRYGFHLFLVERKLEDKLFARQILVKARVTKRDTTRVMKTAERIREEILAGDLTFEEAASVYSEDYMTKDQGGYLGKAFLADMTPPFDSIAMAIDSGEISKPFLSEAGVHLVYAIDKKNEEILSFDDIQIDLRNYLVAMEREEWLNDIVEEARQEFYVEKKL